MAEEGFGRRARAFSERQDRRPYSLMGSDAPAIARARSQEFSVAESVAVPGDPSESSSIGDERDHPLSPSNQWPSSVRYLILLCAFLTSLSFGVTQVPLLYVILLMTCDTYYEDYPSAKLHESSWRGITFPPVVWSSVITKPHPSVDRCSINAIESSTALSIALLGATTTIFGILNLFFTGRLIKQIGVKSALFIQVFFPAIRLLVQNVGVEVWGSYGIIIIQCSQIVSIIGGPSGYLLALNTFTTDVVQHEGRTAALGRLSGSQMFGSAIGFLLGGTVADIFGNKAPFRLTLVLFLMSSAYTAIFLPYIPPDERKTHPNQSSQVNEGSFLRRILSPLAIFAPRPFIGQDGIVRTEYGSFLLAWGVFLGILATGYLQTLLQLYATDVFGFGTQENGLLIFTFSMLRGGFLTFVFPIIIAIGRKQVSKREESYRSRQGPNERDPLLSSTNGTQEHESVNDREQRFTFDLTYTRFSLIIDGLLTLLCSLANSGWQMYLVAAVLPFGSGTGSAAKGTVLQMVGASASSWARTDALAGVSLVENIARLSTTFVFGVIFSMFASIGRTELVFVCNAAVAMIGFVVLLFARFPRAGSRPLSLGNDASN